MRNGDKIMGDFRGDNPTWEVCDVSKKGKTCRLRILNRKDTQYANDGLGNERFTEKSILEFGKIVPRPNWRDVL